MAFRRRADVYIRNPIETANTYVLLRQPGFKSFDIEDYLWITKQNKQVMPFLYPQYRQLNSYILNADSLSNEVKARIELARSK